MAEIHNRIAMIESKIYIAGNFQSPYSLHWITIFQLGISSGDAAILPIRLDCAIMKIFCVIIVFQRNKVIN